MLWFPSKPVTTFFISKEIALLYLMCMDIHMVPCQGTWKHFGVEWTISASMWPAATFLKWKLMNLCKIIVIHLKNCHFPPSPDSQWLIPSTTSLCLGILNISIQTHFMWKKNSNIRLSDWQHTWNTTSALSNTLYSISQLFFSVWFLTSWLWIQICSCMQIPWDLCSPTFPSGTEALHLAGVTLIFLNCGKGSMGS